MSQPLEHDSKQSPHIVYISNDMELWQTDTEWDSKLGSEPHFTTTVRVQCPIPCIGNASLLTAMYISIAKNFHTHRAKFTLHSLLINPQLDVTDDHLHLYMLPTALNNDGLVQVLIPNTSSVAVQVKLEELHRIRKCCLQWLPQLSISGNTF